MTLSHDKGNIPPMRANPLHPDDVADREPTLPAVSALRTMVLVAQFGSFSRAAEVLGITQSGVSRAINGLEQMAGRRIFERSSRGMTLTEAGKRYLNEVREVLAQLGAATQRFSSFDSAVNTLHIATLPSFGSLWLAPRLSGFTRRFPDISLAVVENIGLVDFAQQNIDCVIHYGSTAWPEGARSETLMNEVLVPYVHPELLQARAKAADVLLDIPLIQHTHRPMAWHDWFRQVGLEHPNPTMGHRFEQYQMGIGAAASGLGAVLMPPFLVGRELEAGRLVALHAKPVESAWTFQLVYPDAKRQNPVLQKFRSWIQSEVRVTKLSSSA